MKNIERMESEVKIENESYGIKDCEMEKRVSEL